MPKVLIIDDNEASAKTMGWTMEMLGQEVQLAFNATTAIPLALSFRPDVILMDIGLPGMDGYELCTLLKKEPALQGTIFIAQTGWGQEEHRQRSKAAGFDHHMVKPIDFQKLEELLRTLKKAA